MRPRMSKFSEDKSGVLRLKECLNELVDVNGEMHVTRFAREITGVETRECQQAEIESPSSMTKRRIHESCAHRCGHKLKSDNKGNRGSVSEHKRVQDSDAECDPCCSWRHFRQHWKHHCTFMKIRPKSEDVCGDCAVTANKMKCAKRKTGGNW